MAEKKPSPRRSSPPSPPRSAPGHYTIIGASLFFALAAPSIGLRHIAHDVGALFAGCTSLWDGVELLLGLDSIRLIGLMAMLLLAAHCGREILRAWRKH
jgi:hypothetical protein